MELVLTEDTPGDLYGIVDVLYEETEGHLLEEVCIMLLSLYFHWW